MTKRHTADIVNDLRMHAPCTPGSLSSLLTEAATRLEAALTIDVVTFADNVGYKNGDVGLLDEFRSAFASGEIEGK